MTLITSFFTNSGAPALGLTPVIRIWEVTAGSQTLDINNDPMVEVGDGFYKYDYTTYDPTKDYVFRTFGGAGLPAAEQYQHGSTDLARLEATTIAAITGGVWEESAGAHLNLGTTGFVLNAIKADTANIVISVGDAITLIQTLLKYSANRTRIDTTAKTLTIYDDDCVTPLIVFDLKDSAGNPSVTEVCERKPTTCP